MAAIFNTMGYHRKEAMFTLYAARLASTIANSNQHILLSEVRDKYLVEHQLGWVSVPSWTPYH